MYMCSYNSGEIGKPPLYGTGEKQAARQLKSSGTDWQASDGPRNRQLPEAVGGRTLRAPLTKSQHKGNNHGKATGFGGTGHTFKMPCEKAQMWTALETLRTIQSQ